MAAGFIDEELDAYLGQGAAGDSNLDELDEYLSSGNISVADPYGTVDRNEHGTPYDVIYDKSQLPNEEDENAFDLGRGFVAGVDSMQGTGYGLVGLGGAASNRIGKGMEAAGQWAGEDSVLGKVANAAGGYYRDVGKSVRDWGFEGYQENMEEVQSTHRDEYTYEGVDSVGDAIFDFIPYWLGYAVPQIITAAASGGIGGAIAKKATTEAVEIGVKEYMTSGLAKEAIEKVGVEAAEAAVRQKLTAAAVAKGAIPATAPQAFGMELGATYGGAGEAALEKGGTLEDVDLGRVGLYGTAAGATEFAGDVLTLGLGKLLPGVKFDMLDNFGDGLGGAVASGATRATIGGAAEGTVETVQTGLEEMGAGKSFEEANFSDPTSFFAGAVGGAGLGAIGGRRISADEETDLLEDRGGLTRATDVVQQATINPEEKTQSTIDRVTGVGVNSPNNKADFEAALSENSPFMTVDPETQVERPLTMGEWMSAQLDAQNTPAGLALPAPQGTVIEPARIVYPDGSVSDIVTTMEDANRELARATNAATMTTQQGDAVGERPAAQIRQAILQKAIVVPAEATQDTIDRLTGVGQNAGVSRQNVAQAAAEQSGQMLVDDAQIESPMSMEQRMEQLAVGTTNEPLVSEPTVDPAKPVTDNTARQAWNFLRSRSDSPINRALNKADFKFLTNHIKGKSLEDIATNVRTTDPARAALVDYLLSKQPEITGSNGVLPANITQTPATTTTPAEATTQAPATTETTATQEQLKSNIQWTPNEQRYLRALMDNPDMAPKDAAEMLGVKFASLSRTAKNVRQKLEQDAKARGMTIPEYINWASPPRQETTALEGPTTLQDEIAQETGQQGGQLSEEDLRLADEEGNTTGTSIRKSANDSQVHEAAKDTKQAKESKDFLEASDPTSKTNMGNASKTWTDLRRDNKSLPNFESLSQSAREDFSRVAMSNYDRDVLLEMAEAAASSQEVATTGTNTTAEKASKDWTTANKLLSIADKGTMDQQPTNEQEALLKAIDTQPQLGEVASRYDEMTPEEQSQITYLVNKLVTAIRNGTYYRRQKEGPKSKVAQVEQWLKGPIGKLASWVSDIKVVQSVSEIPGTHPSDAAGMVHQGTVYLVADNIGSRKEAKVTLAHEVVGHIGLEQLLGKDFDQLLKTITAMKLVRNPMITEIVADLRRKYVDYNGGYTLDEKQEAREILAHFVEKNPNFGLARKVLAKIRLWLAKMGLGDMDKAQLNMLAVNAATLTQNELESTLSKAVVADAYQRTEQLRKSSYGEMFNRIHDKYKTVEFDSDVADTKQVFTEEGKQEWEKTLERIKNLRQKFEQRAEFTDTSDDAAPSELRRRDWYKTFARRLRAMEKIDPETAASAFNIGESHFLTEGNRQVTPENFLPINYAEFEDGEVADFYLDMKIGPFDGFIVRMSYKSDTVSRSNFDTRPDSAIISLLPIENAQELVEDTTMSLDSTNTVTALHFREPLHDVKDVSRAMGLEDELADSIYNNMLETVVYGPSMGGWPFTNHSDDPVFTEHDFPENSEYYGSSYIRFNTPDGFTQEIGNIAHRFLFMESEHNDFAFPNTFFSRETGAYPYNWHTQSGKKPTLLKPEQIQRRYKRTGEDTTAYRRTDDGAESPVDILKNSAPARYLKEFWQKTAPAALTMHALVELYEAKLPAMSDYYKNLNAMEADQYAKAIAGHKVASKWAALPEDARNKLNSLMMDATLKGVDPTKAGELHGRWTELPQKAQEVYKEAEFKLRQDWVERHQLFKETAERAYNDLIRKTTGQKEKAALQSELDRIVKHADKAKSMQGPYFPLVRHGDYLVVSTSQAYADTIAELEDATGNKAAILRKQRDDMEKQDEHYNVSVYESLHQAEEGIALSKQKYDSVYSRLTVQQDPGGKDISARGYERIKEHLKSTAGSKAAASALEQVVTEMYVSSLPENHAMARAMRRKGIHGASSDMLRSFASTVETSSFYLSRFKYNEPLALNLSEMDGQQRALSGDFKTQEVYREILKRRELDMTHLESPYQNILAKLSGMWHLVSPSYWLVNSTQPWFISSPVMAARFGWTRTFDEMGKAFKDAAELVIDMHKKNGFMADVDVSKWPDPQEREMLQSMIDHGRIDINVTADLGAMSRGGADPLSRITTFTMWPAHQVETVNRVMTALAAYRMAKKRMSHQKAVTYADKIIVDTHIDYSNVNAARPMKHGAVPLGKLIFQFRKYQHGMAQLLIMNAKKGLKGDTEALKIIRNMVMMQTATAGVLGVPAMSTIMWLVDFAIDDDDERGDAQTILRNYLAKELGPDFARALMKGPLGYLLGTDLTKRTGLGDVFSPMPFLRTGAKTGQEGLGNLVVSGLGAPAGMVSNMLQAPIHAENGDYLRMVESMMPKGIKDILKAARYENEGIRKRSGATGVAAEEFDAWDASLKALGFSTMKESEYYEASKAQGNVKDGIDTRRNRLLKEYSVARKDRDQSAMKEVNAEIKAFNKEHRKFRITGQNKTQAFFGRAKTDRDKIRKETGMATRNKKLPDLDKFAR